MIDLRVASEEEIVGIVPELLELNDVVENSRQWHKNDTVFNHTMNVFKRLKTNMELAFISEPEKLAKYLAAKVGKLNRAQILLWAALFHDIAKPETLAIINGFTQCPGHEAKGAIKAKMILKRLIVKSKDLNRITDIIKNHDVMSAALDRSTGDFREKIRIAEKDFEDIYPELILHALSDAEGSQLSTSNPEEYKFRITQYHILLNADGFNR